MTGFGRCPFGGFIFFTYAIRIFLSSYNAAIVLLNRKGGALMGILKRRTMKPALVLINPEAWNMIDTYKAIEAYRVKHKSIRRKTKEFEDGHKEVAYYTRNLWYQFYMGYLSGRHTVDLTNSITMGWSINDKIIEKARTKAGVRA